MASPAILIILACCQISVISAKYQMHPRFGLRTSSLLGDYFTGTVGNDWMPSRETVLLQQLAPPGIQLPLRILVSIDDLPAKETIHMRLRYKCSPSEEEEVQELQHPFDNIKSICQSIMMLPLSFETQSAGWDASNTAYHLRLKVQIPTSSQMPFSQALTHYVRIQMDFRGTHWSLNSNGLFIRNWDPLLRFNDGRLSVLSQKYASAQYYLTDDAMRLMHDMKFSTFSGFATEQFLQPEVVRLIASASEFVQSSIGIGAMLTIGAGSCRFSYPSSQIAFMSNQYSGLHKYISMKVLRIDTATGKITYSRYGLSAVARKVVTGLQITRYPCDNRRLGTLCEKDFICRFLSYSPIKASYPYESVDSVKMVDRVYRFDGHLSTPVPMDTCQVLQNSNPERVTVFARAAESYVLCPIICTRYEQNFRFYKGDTLLHPMHEFDFTELGAIRVHKSSTVLLFTHFVTNKDAGLYKCTAGGKEAQLEVDIVALPLFSVARTAWSGGDLPPMTYARIGRGYSLTCTVFYSGMRSVTITPEFYVVVDKRKHAWTKLSGDEFARRLKFYDSEATFSTSRTAYSTSLKLQVSHVPAPTDVFEFSHRFVCNATVSAEDVQRFGVSEYSVQSGTQVVVVSPPKLEDIESKMSPCCAEGCFGKNCVIEYALSSEVQNQLKTIGLEAHGAFKVGNLSIKNDTNMQVTYDRNSGKLRMETVKPVAEMTDEERRTLTQMVPVFNYVTSSNDSVSCERDPQCVLSTENSDKSLRDSLRTPFAGMASAANFNGTSFQALLKALLEANDNAAAGSGATSSNLLLIALACFAVGAAAQGLI